MTVVPGIEGVVFNTLSDIEMTSHEVYPAEAIKNAAAPFIFYEKQSDDEEYALDGFTGLFTAVFGVHCVAVSYAQLVALSGAVRSALQALQGSTNNGLLIEQVVVNQASPDIKEKEVYLYRRMYNLRIKFQEV